MNRHPLPTGARHARSHPAVRRATDRLFATPTESVEMVRHYTLATDDLALIRTKRHPVNRVGFVIQLCLLRYPGFDLEPAEHPPEGMLAFVANQLGAPPAAFADYAQRDQTRRDYVAELQRRPGLRTFGLADWRACLRAGSDAARATDSGELIVVAILAHLRANGVVLPSATVLERIGLAAGLLGVARALEHHRAAEPPRIRARSWKSTQRAPGFPP